MRHILVPPRHLCRLIPAWHPMVPVASREHFILAGLLCCNGNHNTSLRATLQSSAVEDLAAKMGRDGAAACAGIRGSRARKRRRLPGARGADQRIRASGFPLVDDRFQAGFGRRERETGGPVSTLADSPAGGGSGNARGRTGIWAERTKETPDVAPSSAGLAASHCESKQANQKPAETQLIE